MVIDTVVENQKPRTVERISTELNRQRCRMSSCTEQYTGGKSAKLRNSHIKSEIRTIDKLKLSNEVRKQKLEEGQYLAELVLDAEVQIGKLTAAIPKAKNQYDAIRNGADSTKSEALKEIGIKQDTAERYERLARVVNIPRCCLPKA